MFHPYRESLIQVKCIFTYDSDLFQIKTTFLKKKKGPPVSPQIVYPYLGYQLALNCKIMLFFILLIPFLKYSTWNNILKDYLLKVTFPFHNVDKPNSPVFCLQVTLSFIPLNPSPLSYFSTSNQPIIHHFKKMK